MVMHPRAQAEAFGKTIMYISTHIEVKTSFGFTVGCIAKMRLYKNIKIPFAVKFIAIGGFAVLLRNNSGPCARTSEAQNRKAAKKKVRMNGQDGMGKIQYSVEMVYSDLIFYRILYCD